MSRWYRAYEGTVTDAKLGEVALVAECSRSVAIAAWHCLLESAATLNDGGRFDATPRRVAVILNEPPSLIEKVMAEMEALGMIDSGCITAWKRRQYESDSSTERSRKHRNAKRNADATLQQRSATPPDTETDTDIPLANANGAKSDFLEPKAPPDPEKLMFDSGVALLRAGGKSESQSRSLLGKWRKAYGSEAVIVALGTAKREGAVDPVSFIEAALRARHRARDPCDYGTQSPC